MGFFDRFKEGFKDLGPLSIISGLATGGASIAGKALTGAALGDDAPSLETDASLGIDKDAEAIRKKKKELLESQIRNAPGLRSQTQQNLSALGDLRPKTPLEL